MLINIQALRALAAAMVVIVHLEVIAAAAGFSKEQLGRFGVGVDLFFVISGFIMVYTTRRKPTTPIKFALNRIARVVPLYWVLTLALFAAALVAPSFLGGTRATGIALSKSLLFVPFDRGDGLMRPILFVGWTLNFEMFFYAIFAIALVLRGIRLQVAAAVAAIVGCVIVGQVMGDRLHESAGFLLQPILLEFAAGMVLGLVCDSLPTSKTIALAWLAISPLLVYAMIVLEPQSHLWPLSGVPAFLLVLTALLAERAGLVLRVPGVVLLGNASYALYLSHPFLCQGIGRGTAKLGLLTATTAWPLMIAVWLLAICLGIAVHFALERPLNRLAYPLLGLRPRVKHETLAVAP